MARGLMERVAHWWTAARARDRAWCVNCEKRPREDGERFCSAECDWAWFERTGM